MAQAADSGARSRGVVKAATAYRTISEVSDELDVPQHVLRFWETRFSQVRPLKRGGGRRYYRPEDVRLLRRIQKLLYEEGYTIKGVQKLLREGKVRRERIEDGGADTEAAEAIPPEAGEAGEPLEPEELPEGESKPAVLPEDLKADLTDVLAELKALRGMLKPDKG